MVCKKCKSSKLIAFHHLEKDHVYSLDNGYWNCQNPEVNYYFETSSPLTVICLNCNNFEKIEKLAKQKNTQINHKEITLDLDQTLVYVEYTHEVPDSDFKFKDENSTYYAFKRPYLKEFIQFLESYFNKINISTAAIKWYAEHIIPQLNISSSKLGTITTREDLNTERFITFEKEYIKKMDNSLMVDDKSFVIKGHNNKVINVPAFHYYHKNDNGLLKVIDIIKTSQNTILKKSKSSNGIIKINHQPLIDFQALPNDKLNKLTSFEYPHYLNLKQTCKPFWIRKDIAEISFTNLGYREYLIICDLISAFSSHHKMTLEEFNAKFHISPNSNF